VNLYGIDKVVSQLYSGDSRLIALELPFHFLDTHEAGFVDAINDLGEPVNYSGFSCSDVLSDFIRLAKSEHTILISGAIKGHGFLFPFTVQMDARGFGITDGTSIQLSFEPIANGLSGYLRFERSEVKINKESPIKLTA